MEPIYITEIIEKLDNLKDPTWLSILKNSIAGLFAKHINDEVKISMPEFDKLVDNIIHSSDLLLSKIKNKNLEILNN